MNVDIVTGKPISEAGPALALRLARLPDPARGGEVPDGLRPAAAAGHVRRQAPRRCAGGADTVVTQPGRAWQGSPLRPRLRQRPRRNSRRLRPLLRPHGAVGGLRPVPARAAEARARRHAGLPLERGRGLREGVRPTPCAAADRRPRAHRGVSAARARPLPEPRRGRPDRVPRPPQRVREPLRLPRPAR